MDFSKHISGFLVTFACLLIGGLMVFENADDQPALDTRTDIERAAAEARQMLETGRLHNAIKNRPAYKNVMRYRTVLAQLDACDAYDGLRIWIGRVRDRYIEKNAEAYESWLPNKLNAPSMSNEEAVAKVTEGYPPEMIPHVVKLMEEFPLPDARTDPINLRAMERFECEDMLRFIDKKGRSSIRARTSEPLY